MGGHHLVLGELRDYLTGAKRVDTHDERYRQKIARLLVEDRGYGRDDLKARVPVAIEAAGRKALVQVDLTVALQGKTLMLIKYAPGSLTTRHRAALAASRLLEPYQVPFSVVTNGEDAEVLDNETTAVLARGLGGIFSRKILEDRCRARDLRPVSPCHREMAERILYAYEVHGRCPCDDTLCEFDPPASTGEEGGGVHG